MPIDLLAIAIVRQEQPETPLGSSHDCRMIVANMSRSEAHSSYLIYRKALGSDARLRYTRQSAALIPEPHDMNIGA
jgi:hypothetical protein